MNMKRFTAFLLALSVTAGATAAMAAETISVEDESTSVENEIISTQADETTVHNNAILNDDCIGATFYNRTKKIELNFTVMHPKGAPEGRVVVNRIFACGDYMYPIDTDWDTFNVEKSTSTILCTHPISSTDKTTSTFSTSFTQEYSSYTGTMWIIVRTQHNVDGQWVTDTQHGYPIYFAPRLSITSYSDGIVLEFYTKEFDDPVQPIHAKYTLHYREGTSDAWKTSTWTPIKAEDYSGVDGSIDHEEGLYDFPCGGVFIDKNVTNGTKYSYYVDGYINDYDIKPSNIASYYYLDAPEVSVSNSSTGKTMYLSWDRNTEADGYEIRYKDARVKTNQYNSLEYEWEEEPIVRKASGSKTTTLKLKNRTPGRQYWIQARSYKTVNGTKYYSGWSDPTLRYPEGMSAPSTPTFTIKNSSTGKTMYVSRKADPKVSGFVVQYATKLNSNGNLVNFRTVDVPAKDGYTLTLKKRTPGKQYWVRVRSYCYCSEEKLYSDWTELKLRYPKK